MPLNLGGFCLQLCLSQFMTQLGSSTTDKYQSLNKTKQNKNNAFFFDVKNTEDLLRGKKVQTPFQELEVHGDARRFKGAEPHSVP